MRVYLLLLIASMLGNSCSKKSDPTVPYINTLSATVNGTAYTPLSVTVGFGSAPTPNARKIGVSSNWNGHLLDLMMYEYDNTVKTFILSDFSFNQIASFGSFGKFEPGAYYNAQSYSKSGEIKILTMTKYKTGNVITGTFQFETNDCCYGKNSVTDGKFSVFVPE